MMHRKLPSLVNDDSVKEFTIAYAIAPNDGPDIPDMWMWKEYEKKTGIHINWMYVEPASVGEQKNLIMMSDDRPDAWYGSWWSVDEMISLGNDGMLVDLAPYLEKYAPNYVAELNKIDGGYASTVLPDGAVYSTAMIMNDPPQITDRIWLNSDWLNNLGMKAPTTMDEPECSSGSIQDRRCQRQRRPQ